MPNRSDIENRILEIDRLDREVIETVARGGEGLQPLLARFLDLKKFLQVELIDSSAELVHDPRARELLQRLASGPAFKSDRILEALESRLGEEFGENIRLDELDDDEAGDLASDLFYSRFSGDDYVRTLYRLGVVALGMHTPSFLRDFLHEARCSYALQQYLATVALCRSAVEAALNDIAVRKGLLQREATNVLLLEDSETGVGSLIARLANGRLRTELRALYGQCSGIVHARRPLQDGESKVIYDRTIDTLNKLYTSHHM